MERYKLTGRTFYMRKRSASGLGMREHIEAHDMKDYYDSRTKRAYILTEAEDKGDHLLIPRVDTQGYLVGFFKFFKKPEDEAANTKPLWVRIHNEKEVTA